MDARIQMDYDRDAIAPNDIEPDGADFSAITFQTGGVSYYDATNAPTGRVTEKLRIGKFGEIGLNAGSQRYDPTANPPIVDNTGSNRLPEADIYGSPGEVLMSDGKGKSVFWGTNGVGGNLWSQNASGIYRDSDVMIRRSDNGNSASLAVHGNTLSGTAGSFKNVLDLRSTVTNADCLTFRSVRTTGDTTPNWYSAAWRIQRRVDVTDQGYIQFGNGEGVQNAFDSDVIFGTNGDKERLRITHHGDVGIGTDNPTGTNAIVGNNAELAVGIVTCRQLYVNGTQLISSGASVVKQVREAASLAQSSTGTTYADKVTLTMTVQNNSRVLIISSYELASSTPFGSGNNTVAQTLKVNGSFVNDTITNAHNNYFSNSGSKKYDIFYDAANGAGSRSYKIRWKRTSSGQGYIRNARILGIELGIGP